jgi:hypothetical protein
MTALDKAIYELIGAAANLAVLFEVKRGLDELAKILTDNGVESDLWDHYKTRTDALIRKAYKYFANKGDAQTADNIKNTYVKKEDGPLIP